MSKQFADAELVEFSKQIFNQHPDVKFLYVCNDGNFFRDRDKNHATNFARESKQELRQVELVGRIPQLVGMEPEDPQTRDVSALMLALNVTEDKARELIAEHKGNTASAVQAANQTPPTEAVVAKVSKSSTSKKKPADATKRQD